MPEFRPKSFQQRVNYAAQCILNQQTRSREFDSCFEMFDGDLVAAAIVRRCEVDDVLRAALANWQSHGRSSEIPAEWLEAAAKYKDVSNLARKARSVRQQQERETEKMHRTMQREQEPEDEFMKGLRAFVRKINNARFYIALESEDSSSGFYAEAQTRRAANIEASTHLRKYPSWKTATVRRAHQ